MGLMSGIAAVASVAVGAMGANSQANAAKDAANAQAKGAATATAEQKRQFDKVIQLSTPSALAGSSARARQMLMLGYKPEEVRAYLKQTREAFQGPPATQSGTGGGSGSGSGAANSGGGSPHSGAAWSALAGTFLGNMINPDLLPQTASTPATNNTTTTTTTTPPAPDTQDDWVNDYSAQEHLESTPGYQFQLGQGTKALERSAAAKGMLFSGATGTALTEYGQDYGSNYWDRLFAQYGQLAGDGQAATGDVINSGQNYANQAGANARYAGDARASGYANSANAWGNWWDKAAGTVVGAGGWG